MKKLKAGFTLIELIAVILILSILAVAAIPQFSDLRIDASNAASAGVGGALASATALNYARRLGSNSASAIVPILSCPNVNSNIAGLIGTVPAKYSVTAGAAPNTATTAGVSMNCLVHDSTTGTTDQTFTAISAN
jgi:prepilin-type N-terminal cleavage/methylation domain-containing protein